MTGFDRLGTPFRFGILGIAVVMILRSPSVQAQVWTSPDTAVAKDAGGSSAILLSRTPEGGLDMFYFNRSAPDSNHYTRYTNGKWLAPVTVGGPARGILSLDYASNGSRAAVWAGMPVPYVPLPGELTLTHDSSGVWTSGSLFYRNTSEPAMYPAVRFDRNDTLHLAWLIGSNNYMDPRPGDIYAGKMIGNVLADTTNVSKLNWGGQSVNLVRDSAGMLHLCWEAQNQALLLTQFHAVWAPTGWTPPQELGPGQATFLNVDRLGNLHLVSREGLGPEVQYRSFDGHAWSSPVRLSRGQVYTGTGGWEPYIRFDSRNRPIVIWGGRTMCIRSNGHWSLPRTIPTDDGLDRESNFQVSNGNTLHLVWQKGSSLLHSTVVIDTTPPWFRHSATTRDTYVACKGITVTWSAEDEQEIVENLVEFSSNGGRTWTTIDTLFGHPDSISWTLPKIFSDSCYVRIICDDYWHNSSQSTSERFRIINEPPTQPVLMGPPDSLHLYTAGTWFDWSNSTDAPCDTVRYYIRIWSSILDTTVGPLAKPPIYFNGIRWFRKDTTYYWTVLATDGRDTSWGTQGVWRFFVADTLLPVCPDAEVPLKFALSQNYPNPFNSSTTIRYDLPHKSTVQLVVYNTLGQQVATLVHREKEAGFHEVKFDGTGLSTGVYLYRIQAGDFVQTLKLLLLR